MRVWFTTCPTPENTRQLIAICKQQVSIFSGALPGGAYLFCLQLGYVNVC
jgi:hypothetical protein